MAIPKRSRSSKVPTRRVAKARWRWTALAAYLAIFYCAALFAGPATQPASAPSTMPTSAPAVDPALWARMTDIDARASRITTLTADFTQMKYTALLRKPLVSNGVVKVKGAVMRWDTARPEPAVMVVGDKSVQLYYPAYKTVEEYSIDQRLAELAASPLPRLAALKDRFSLVELPARDIDAKADPAKFLALKLTPLQQDLRDHVQEVRVLLDSGAGYIVQAEFTDADGDRTVIRFSNTRVNGEVGDLELKTPLGTRWTHPMEGLQPPSPSRS